MSKVVKGILGVGSAALGVASFIPGPWQPFAAAGSVGLGLFGKIGGAGKSGQSQFEALQQLAQMLQQPPPFTETVGVDGPAPRMLAYGRVCNAGVNFLRENTPNKTVYINGLYLNDGPIDGLDALICDDEFVPLTNIDALGNANPYFWPSQGSKKAGVDNDQSTAKLVVELVNGTPFGRWSLLLRGADEGFIIFFGWDTGWRPFWNATHIGQGCTLLYALAKLQGGDRLSNFPNGFPKFKTIYRAARVYDPRDPGQRFRQDAFSIYTPDESWKWSENPALCAAHYVSYLISQKLTAIRGVDWEAIAEAADDCDRLAPKRMNGFNGGKISSEPFARVSALIPLDMEPRDALAKFMESCDGEWGVDHNGRFTMWINKWEEPSVVFTGADIGDYTEEFGAPMKDEANYVHTTYVDPRQSYKWVETSIFRDLKSESEIGRRTIPYSYDWVNSTGQAYRLTARKIKRANGRRRIDCTLGPRAMTALKQRVVGLDYPDFGLVGTWRVEDLSPMDATLSRWRAELTEMAPDDYTDEIIPDDPILGLGLVNQPSIATPTALLPSAIVTGSSVGRALLSLDVNKNHPDQSNPTIEFAALLNDPTLTLDGRWSIDGGATWTNFDILLSALVMETPELPRGTVVTMQARFVATSGAVGAYSSSVTATIP